MATIIKVEIKPDGIGELHLLKCDMKLESMQREVGGYIEIVDFPYKPKSGRRLRIVCDEEGLLKNKQPSFVKAGLFIVGDILICAEDYSEEEEGYDLVGLRKSEAYEILEYLCEGAEIIK